MKEYKPTPNPDCEKLIRGLKEAGIARCVAEPVIIKRDMELSARVAYA